VVVPNGVLATDATDGIPFFIGDFKEAIKIFDREQLSIMTSNTASVTGFNAFEQDMTLFRAIERLDCVVQDTGAWVYLGK
jgi:HK97 family phage major capsid protein